MLPQQMRAYDLCTQCHEGAATATSGASSRAKPVAKGVATIFAHPSHMKHTLQALQE